MFRIVLLSVLSALLAGKAAEAACISGYEEIGESCIHIGATAMSWIDAENYCLFSMDGSLAVLSDCYLYKTVAHFLDITGVGDVWIGATDQITEGVWVWNNDSPVEQGQPLWGYSSTYVMFPSSSTAKNCLLLDQTYHYYGIDADCDANARPLCQTEPV